jgi:hypothetical protein
MFLATKVHKGSQRKKEYLNHPKVSGTVRKNVKTPLKALNEEVLVTTFAFLRTVPIPLVRLWFPFLHLLILCIMV